MRVGLTIMAAGVLLGTPAAPVWAQQNNGGASFELGARLVTTGTWEFRSRDRREDDRPVCTETWTFRKDGTATVISGQQLVDKRWRTVVDDDGLRWLYTAGTAGTAGPDCTGALDDPATYPREEVGFVLLFANDGSAYTCEPPARIDGPDGKGIPTWTDEGCWGEIRPVGPGGD